MVRPITLRPFLALALLFSNAYTGQQPDSHPLALFLSELLFIKHLQLSCIVCMLTLFNRKYLQFTHHTLRYTFADFIDIPCGHRLLRPIFPRHDLFHSAVPALPLFDHSLHLRLSSRTTS